MTCFTIRIWSIRSDHISSLEEPHNWIVLFLFKLAGGLNQKLRVRSVEVSSERAPLNVCCMFSGSGFFVRHQATFRGVSTYDTVILPRPPPNVVWVIRSFDSCTCSRCAHSRCYYFITDISLSVLSLIQLVKIIRLNCWIVWHRISCPIWLYCSHVACWLPWAVFS